MQSCMGLESINPTITDPITELLLLSIEDMLEIIKEY
jgi:hypothetical protein